MAYSSRLDPAKNEIRLLKLYLGEIDQDLTGDLVVVSLHTHFNSHQCATHHPPYEALSYQWGSVDKQHRPTITINGVPTTITPNLHSALRHIRNSGTERTLWIDALCINQDDLEEKSSQVQCMAGIYQLAKQVLVWLGDASLNSDLAISTLKQLGGDNRSFSVSPDSVQRTVHTDPAAGPTFHHFTGLWPYEFSEDLRREGLPDPLSAVPSWLEAIWAEGDIAARKLGLLSVAGLSEEQWRALEDFFSPATRPWWTRIWIIQEVTLAREVVIHCGHSTVLWDTLHDALRQRSCIKHTRLQRAQLAWRALDQMRTGARNPIRFHGMEIIGLSLMEIAARFSTWHSTDPRDKIYALLGFASGAASRQVYPRYGSSVADAFSEAAAAMIEEHQNLDVLCQVHHLEDDVEVKNWPSWVPDWSRLQDTKLLIDIENGIRPYDASGPWSHSTMTKPPDGSGHIQGGWAQSTAGADANQARLRWPSQHTAPPTVKFPTKLHRSGGFHAVLRAPQHLEVHGFSWSQIETIHGQLPSTGIDSDDAPKSQVTLLQLYTSLKSLPRFHSRSYPLLAEAMTAGNRRDSRRKISALEFYHGFILMSLLLRGMYRFSKEAVSSGIKDPQYQLRQYRRVMAFLTCIGYIDRNLHEYGKATTELPNMVHDFLAISNPSHQRGWKLAVLENQHYGVVPSGARKGDKIAVVMGSCVPFVLRPEEGGAWRMVGSCYFFHIMAGEVVQAAKGPLEKIVLS